MSCGLARAEIYMLREVKWRLHGLKESYDRVTAEKLRQAKAEENRVKDAERRARHR